MLRALALSSFLFVGAVSVASADVYRWVDEQGSVHYSDQWVPGSQLIKSTQSRSSSADSANTVRRTSDTQKPTPSYSSSSNDPSSAVQAVKEDKAKVREQQCKDAKDRYDKAILARRIYKPTQGDKSKEDPDAREYLSDEEADAYRVKTRQDMQELCGDSAK
jgi:uncharacterized protein DUF4124